MCACLILLRTARAQEPRIKRRIAVTYQYNSPADKNPYKSVHTTEYDKKGNELNPEGISTHSDSSVVVQKNGNCTHRKQYWSDSSILDQYLYVYKDSQILITMSAADTMMIQSQILRHGSVLRSYCHITGIRWGRSDEETIFYKNTHNIKRGITNRSAGYGHPDSFRFYKNRMLQVTKTFAWNSDTHKWFQDRKTKTVRTMRIEWETFYHSYFKRYFTTRTTSLFDPYGHTSEEVKYNMQRRYIESKTMYEYEYY